MKKVIIIFIPCLWGCIQVEQKGSPVLSRLGIDQNAGALQPGGNMEGKEARFGIVNSCIWATATTAASNGSGLAHTFSGLHVAAPGDGRTPPPQVSSQPAKNFDYSSAEDPVSESHSY